MIIRLLLIHIALIGFALAQEFEIRHDLSRLDITETELGHVVNYNGITNLSAINPQLDSPDLPVYLYKVLLPEGTSVESINILSIDKSPIKGAFHIVPREKPWRQDIEEESTEGQAGSSLFVGIYPNRVIRYLYNGRFGGQTIAHFEVFPVQYNAAEKSLHFIDNISFSLNTDMETVASVQSASGTPSAEIAARALSTSDAENVNTSLVFTGTGNPISPFADMENGLIDQYVVITTKELEESFASLVEWKTQKGIPAVVRTMTWIRNSFPDGVDDAERMRNYIRWTYRYRGTRYVLLGGETELVPTRIITTGGYTFPTDYYFSDLDGSWNDNQNSVFGEAVDHADAYPEVWVSRIPVETPEDVARFTKKLFKYEKLQDVFNPDYPTNVLYLAADLKTENDSRDKLILKQIDPQINHVFKRTLLSQSEHIGSSHDIPYAELSKNYAMIFTENHGAYHVIHPGKPGPSSIFAYEANGFTNVDPSVWYIASCSTNDIAKRSFSEVYMRSEYGGVAFIGNSNFEYPFSGIYLQKEFYSLVFNKGYYHLAEAHFLSRLPYLGYMSWEGPSRIIVLSTIVLGDPEMPIWTNHPQIFNVEMSGTDLINFHVTNQADSSDVENARVTLYRDGSVYKIAETDESGNVYFTRSEINEREVTCTITAHNYIPYQRNLNLPSPPGAILQIAAHDRLLQGIDNDICEPGEKYSLDLTLTNAGDDLIDSSLVIRIPAIDSLIHFTLDSLQIELFLAPDDHVDAGGLDFSIKKYVRSDTSIIIPIMMYLGNSHFKTEYHSIDIYCPVLKTAEMNWFTSTNEDSSLYPYLTTLDLLIQNNGLGAVDSLIAVISADANISFIDTNLCFIGSIDPGNEYWKLNAFSFHHKKPLSELEIIIELAVDYCLQNTQNLNFVQPEAVSSLSFLPSNSSAIQLGWTPSTSSDISGYHIYRRKSGEQDFLPINFSPIQNGGYYLDDFLQVHQSYDYMIRAQDSSGNFSSVSSDTVTAWASLPYWQNFPQRINEQAMGSNQNGVQIADLTGDGRNEIITSGGLGVLKVMNDQAELIFEITNLKGMLTLPAIGNVFGNKSKEIIVSSYTEGRPVNFLYIIDGSNGEVIQAFDLGFNAPTSVVLKDLDKDGLDDIILLTHAGNSPEPPKNSRLLIWRSSGSDWEYFPGWSRDGYMLADNISLGTPAVADLDQSGDITVVVSTFGGKLHGFKPVLSENPIWTTSLPGRLNAPMCIADVDGNDTLDIIVPAMQENRLYVVNHSGQQLSDWNGGIGIDVTDFWGFSAPAAIGNLDDDEALEIVYAGLQNVYVIDHDATVKDGWPIPIDNSDQDKNFCNFSSPVLADLNHDGQSEIIFTTTFGWLHAIDPLTKKNMPGFPIDVHLDIIDGHSPLIEDIEKDGDLDILFLGHDGILHIWDTESPYLDGTKIHWNQAHANPAHTGVLDTTFLQMSSNINEKSSATLPAEFYINANFPNPFNPVTTIEFGLDQLANVRVTIYNLLGQKVKILLDNTRAAGHYSVQWNGRNQHNVSLSSGIYFYRVDITHPANHQILMSQTGKMIFLK